MSIDISAADEDLDPFDAAIQLSGTDTTGQRITAWARLTPTVITDIINRLDDLLRAQQDALRPPGTDTPSDPDPAEPKDPPGVNSADKMKRFLDPMGLRHLKGRSNKSTLLLASALAGLLLVAVVVQLLRP